MSPRYPATPATRVLEAASADFTPYLFPYVEKGGTRHSAEVLGVPEHSVIKTLIFQDEAKAPLCVLMHGDMRVLEKAIAKAAGVRSVSPCDPAVAEKHSGYKVGGTSPFGLRRAMRIFVEATIFDLELIHINGGKRGFLVSFEPIILRAVLTPTVVTAGAQRI